MLGTTKHLNKSALENLYKDIRNPAIWSDQRLTEVTEQLAKTPPCFMKGDDCKYKQLNFDGARFTVVDSVLHIGCEYHMETFALIEGVEIVRVRDFSMALVEEKKRRDEQAAFIKRREEMFRNRIRHTIAVREGVEIELVTDADVDGRVKQMTPQAIQKVQELLDRQEAERRGVQSVVKGINGSRKAPEPRERIPASGMGNNIRLATASR